MRVSLLLIIMVSVACLCSSAYCDGDSVTLETAPADTLGTRDSVRVGKRDTVDVRPPEKMFIGGHLVFLIPISKTLDRLRSDAENDFERNRMDQDAEDRFDDNDIAFPVGVDVRYRLFPWLEPAFSLSGFRTGNSNSWTPRPGDSLVRARQVNGYSLTALHAALDMQLNIPNTILTLDNFHRLWVGLAADFYPYVLYNTDRTRLSGGIRARGMGYGGTFSAGAERFMENNASFFGEIGFGIRTLSDFTVNGRVVAENEVLGTGSNRPLTLDFRSLFFKFGYGRWF